MSLDISSSLRRKNFRIESNAIFWWSRTTNPCMKKKSDKFRPARRFQFVSIAWSLHRRHPLHSTSSTYCIVRSLTAQRKDVDNSWWSDPSRWLVWSYCISWPVEIILKWHVNRSCIALTHDLTAASLLPVTSFTIANKDTQWTSPSITFWHFRRVFSPIQIYAVSGYSVWMGSPFAITSFNHVNEIHIRKHHGVSR